MESKSLIVPLTGANYATWKIQVKMCLVKEDLWRVVSGDEMAPTDASALNKFNLRKDRALATVVLAVDPKLLYLIGEPADPVEVWTKLQDCFQKKSWSNKLSLKKKLYSLKLQEGGDLQMHLKVMIELFDALSVVGAPVNDEDRVISLLSSLPAKYDTLVTMLEALDSIPSWETVTERLRHEDQKHKGDYESEKAMYSKRHPKKNFSDVMNVMRLATLEEIVQDLKLRRSKLNVQLSRKMKLCWLQNWQCLRFAT